MGSSVGFASSVTQAKAARAKKSRKAAAVPQTPEIKLAVEEFRAKVQLARDEVAQRISIGEMVTARTYTSGGEKRQQFADVGIVKVINREMRKDFRTGKVQPHNRVTVLVDGKRYDVLEAMLEPAYAHEAAPAPKPSPLPEKVVVIDTEPLLLMPPKIAGYLPSCIEKNFRTVAMVNRQSIRREWLVEQYDAGKLTAEDFAPELPPHMKPAPIDFKQVTQKPYQYHGGYYGSYAYYNRNR